jgi:putative addiction module component (TIGR02574 family)
MPSEPAADVLSTVLALPVRERARIAHELILSLDDGADADAAEAWVAELEKRVREVRSGSVKTEAWAAVRSQLASRWRGRPMKVVALAKAKNELSAYVEEAQRGRVLVTRHGRPAALIIGVEGEEFEDLMTRSDPEFWRMIETRRSTSKTISASEMRKRLGLAKKRHKWR